MSCRSLKQVDPLLACSDLPRWAMQCSVASPLQNKRLTPGASCNQRYIRTMQHVNRSASGGPWCLFSGMSSQLQRTYGPGFSPKAGGLQGPWEGISAPGSVIGHPRRVRGRPCIHNLERMQL